MLLIILGVIDMVLGIYDICMNEGQSKAIDRIGRFCIGCGFVLIVMGVEQILGG